MKRLLLLAVVLVFASATTTSAAFLTFGTSDLMSFAETYDNPVGNATLNTVTNVPPVTYDIDLTGTGFSQIQIGYDKPQDTLPSTYWNISAYDSYKLAFKNTSSSDWIAVNIYLNTGWTDAPYSQTNQFDEDTWTWLAPSQSATLALDLTTLGTITSGGIGVGDDRREWVSGIGFAVGTNIGSGPYQGGGTDIQVQVSAVPIPGAVILLGSGLLGLIGFGRRLRK